MSIQAIAWVLDHSRSEGLDRLVLLSLANHANSDTGQCDPGYRRIAGEANCSRGTVANAVAHLVELGEVAVLETGRGKATTKYHLPWLSTGLRSVQPRVDARESVASNDPPVASKIAPVASNVIGRNQLTNRTAHDAAPDGGVGAKNPTRTAREIVADDEASLAGEGGPVRVGAALTALAEARAALARKAPPVSQLFDDTPDAAKTRHPSNLPERKDLA